jgi:streptogramin lyase
MDETDKVWASVWSAQVMLRFDPATEQFETLKSSCALCEATENRVRPHFPPHFS